MLRSAYFQDFKGGPKILFWGDASSMRELAKLLNASSVGSGPLVLNSFVEAVDGKTITIRAVTKPSGMQISGNDFQWALDPETMTEFAELVDALAESTRPGHQYLTCGVDDEITVMASCGEYPPYLNPRL
jgi:hypothetical protein